MSEVDEDVRAALHGPTDLRPAVMDLQQIMKSGRRLRRRRAAARAAAALTVLALFAGGVQISGLLDRSDQRNTPAVTPTPTTRATPGGVLHIQDKTSMGLAAPLGEVIDTGLRTGPGRQEWVIYGVSGKGLRGASFAFAIGFRKGNDTVTADYLATEYPGFDSTAPGFHPMQGDAYMQDGSILPAFGYYVGAAAKVTASYDGKPVTARTVRWSRNHGVTVFWFDTDVVNGGAAKGGLTNVQAVDAAGRRLPQGHLVINTP